jgi:hypothetical protein
MGLGLQANRGGLMNTPAFADDYVVDLYVQPSSKPLMIYLACMVVIIVIALVFKHIKS